MELKEVYLLAKNNNYKDFKEEIDYRITGQLRTNVSYNEFEVKLILPVVIRQSEQLSECEHPFDRISGYKVGVPLSGMYLNNYQKADAITEFYKLLKYVEELEQLYYAHSSIQLPTDEEINIKASERAKQIAQTNATPLISHRISFRMGANFVKEHIHKNK